MLEENKTVENGTVENTDTDYLAAIKELKENSVPKAEYEKLKADRNRLLGDYINGSSPEKEPITEKVDIDSEINQLRTDLFGEDKELSNLEYAEKTLKLRKLILERDGEDIFVGASHDIAPTNEDYEAASRVADVIEECVKLANGSNGVFVAELDRRTIDITPMRKR